MPSKPKKTYSNKKNVEFTSSVEIAKENCHLNINNRTTSQNIGFNDQFKKVTPLKQEVKLKPLSFWGKKVKDLESKKDTTKKQYELYELSELDDSTCSKKGQRKRKPKSRVKKKKPEAEFQLRFHKTNAKSTDHKIKKAHERSLLRERITLNREKANIEDKNKNFTFTTTTSTLGITSTPAFNKVNLVGASNFMFLSPVTKEKDVSSFVNDESQKIVKAESVVLQNNSPDTKTPKRLNKVCFRRVLRDKKLVSQE